MTADLTRPVLYCPIDAAVHSNAKNAEVGAFEWMDRCQLFSNESKRSAAFSSNSAEVSARIIPHAPDDLLLFLSTYMYWGFFADDVFDSGPVDVRKARFADLAPQYMRALETPCVAATDDQPLTVLYRELRLFLQPRVTLSQLRRWIDANFGWLLGQTLEIGDAERHTVPTINDFLFVRTYTMAGRCLNLTVELAGGGGEVPEHERESPRAQAINHIVAVLMGLYADLFSLAKEEPGAHNIVNILANENRCPTAEAVRQAVALSDRIMALFLRLREQIARHASTEMRCYLDNLGHLLRGVLDWGPSVARYHGPQTSEPPEGIACTDRPSDPDPSPLPYPTVSWWWSQLEA
jgi:Terpene synthase family 2, C-terminal metal binding